MSGLLQRELLQRRRLEMALFLALPLLREDLKVTIECSCPLIPGPDGLEPEVERIDDDGRQYSIPLLDAIRMGENLVGKAPGDWPAWLDRVIGRGVS